MSEVYSHSRLKCYENCPKQFHFRYVLQIPEEQEGIEAFVGKRVHEVLERLYLFVRNGQVPGLPRVLHRFEQMWQSEYDPERVRVVREGTPVEFYRRLGLRCLEGYYRRNYPFDRDETLGVEEKVEFDLDADPGPGSDSGSGRYRMQGIIDRIARARDGAIEIHDYKTGSYVPNQEAIDEERQLALYQIGLGDRFGAARPVRLVWHYVARGIVRTSTRTRAQLTDLRQRSMARIDDIRAEREYAPRKSPLCGWCDYRSRCPAWNPHAIARRPRPPVERQAPSPASAPRQLQLL